MRRTLRGLPQREYRYRHSPNAKNLEVFFRQIFFFRKTTLKYLVQLKLFDFFEIIFRGRYFYFYSGKLFFLEGGPGIPNFLPESPGSRSGLDPVFGLKIQVQKSITLTPFGITQSYDHFLNKPSSDIVYIGLADLGLTRILYPDFR